MHRWACTVTACISAVFPLSCTAAEPIDAGALRAGVKEVAAPGSPGPLCLFSPQAVAVVAGKGDGRALQPVVAASILGAGRVVALGHSGYLDPGNLKIADTGRLLKNVFIWAGGKAAPSVAVLDHKGLHDWLVAEKFTVKSVKAADLKVATLREFDVIVLGQGALSDAEIEALQSFARGGHGIVMAGLGWGWLQLNPGKTLAQHPGNRLLAESGIVWADGTVGKSRKAGFTVDDADLALLNASSAVETLERHAKRDAPRPTPDQLSQASATATAAARAIPDGDQLLLPRIRQLASEHAPDLAPTDKKPLDARKPLERFLLAFDVRRIEGLAPADVKAHPAAATFPGTVPADAPRIDREFTLALNVPGWRSTGLYAAPGEVVTVVGADPQAKLHVQIGCHKDQLWGLASWKRVPDVVSSWPLDKAQVQVASAFGGLIYIIVPDKADAKSVTLTIKHAVPAPRFVLGQTTHEQWLAQRALPGPWAELETAKIILSFPSSSIRSLDDAEALMKFWDEVSDAHADLAAIPHERKRPERYVADVQISAGYMHSGYPIMVQLDAPAFMTDLAGLRVGKHAWGPFHELGHNHQQGDWTFDGTGEVTCNLFSLHALEVVCHLPPGQRGHDAADKAPKSLQAYLAKPDFAKWKSDPFLALWMYIQLREAFGWEPFKKVFAEYRALPKDQHPRNDDEKRDQWMVRMSRAVGKNLGPFFESWGVPTSPAARESIKDLPAWMPAK